MRIDVNAHFGQWQYWDVPDKTPEDLVALMDRNGIERAACMSLRGLLLDWRQGNAETLAAAEKQPHRLVPIATVGPFLEGDGDELRRLVDAGVRGVRLYPAFHNYPLGGEFVDEICAAAADCGVPVILPTRPMMNWRFKAVAIEDIGGVVERHPATTFLMSGPNYLVEYQAMVKLMRRCSNVAYEISCLQGFESVAKLVAEVGAERVLFGTGAVLQNPACNVAKLDGAKIASEQRRMIEYDNAIRLLGIKP